jgi:hypothetical protein
MSFTHLEQALVLLKTYDAWSPQVASIVRQRFQIPEDRIQAANDEELRTLVPEVDLKNYVFMAEYDMSLNAHYLQDAFSSRENVKGNTAFVSFFRLTQLEHLMLKELNVIQKVYMRHTLKREFDNANLQPGKAKSFHEKYANLFGDFSETNVVDMMQLAKRAKERQVLNGGGQVDCSAFYIFYIQYYLEALKLCGRQETRQLHEAMKGLNHNLAIKDLINADLLQQEFTNICNYKYQRRWPEHALKKEHLPKHESKIYRHALGVPPRSEHEPYPSDLLPRPQTTTAQIYYC